MNDSKKEMLQNISGGVLSGDLSPKRHIFPKKSHPNIRRDFHFTTSLIILL